MARENHATAVMALAGVARDRQVLEVERRPRLFSAMVEPEMNV